jgi:hypothetical protein
LIIHFVENYRNKIKNIAYVDTFQTLILRYDQMQGYNSAMEQALLDHSVDATVTQENNPRFVRFIQQIRGRPNYQQQLENCSKRRPTVARCQRNGCC